MSGDIFVDHKVGNCYWHLEARDAPIQPVIGQLTKRIFWLKMSAVPK